MDQPANSSGQTPPAASPPRPAPKAGRSIAWLFGLLPVLLVVGVVVGYMIWGPQGEDHGGLGQPAAAVEPESLRVVEGRDYYVFVKTIELYPEQADGGTWDKLGGSAPDIRYSLSWQGHTGFTSDARDDTLIGVWDPITIDVAEALPMIGEGKLELRSTLNQGAIINITEGQTLTINIWDQDPAGLGSDAAGQVVINVVDLLQGDQTLRFEKSETNAIKRVVLGTTDTSQPLRSLIEALSATQVPG